MSEQKITACKCGNKTFLITGLRTCVGTVNKNGVLTASDLVKDGWFSTLRCEKCDHEYDTEQFESIEFDLWEDTKTKESESTS